MAAILAYLDAGSGCMIVQLLLGGAAAVIVAVKLRWAARPRLLRLRPQEPRESDTGSTGSD